MPHAPRATCWILAVGILETLVRGKTKGRRMSDRRDLSEDLTKARAPSIVMPLPDVPRFSMCAESALQMSWLDENSSWRAGTFKDA